MAGGATALIAEFVARSSTKPTYWCAFEGVSASRCNSRSAAAGLKRCGRSASERQVFGTVLISPNDGLWARCRTAANKSAGAIIAGQYQTEVRLHASPCRSLP